MNKNEEKNVCPYCGTEYVFSRFCGADVCPKCNYHKGLQRCYCGWGLPHMKEEHDMIPLMMLKIVIIFNFLFPIFSTKTFIKCIYG